MSHHHRMWFLGCCLCLAVLASSISGCKNNERSDDDDGDNVTANVEGYELTVLMFGDSDLKANIESQWQSEGHKISLVTEATFDGDPQTLEKLFDRVDAVIYSPSNLGTLIDQNRIRDLDYENLNQKLLAPNDILRLYRRDMVQYGGPVWATSIGSPMFCLVYRDDVLKAIDEEPPRTWEQYQKIAVKLAASKGKLQDNQGQPLPTAVIEPTKGDWGAKVLLARSASAICQRGQLANEFSLSDAEPMIHLPPFQRSLENMKRSLAGHDLQAFTPDEAFLKIAQGSAAMAITWPTSAVDFEETHPALSVAPLPAWKNRFDTLSKSWTPRTGNNEQAVLLGVDGRLASVAFKARNKEAAEYFVAWISSASNQQKIWTQSPVCSLTRNSQIQKPYAWCGKNVPRQVADQYAAAVKKNNADGLVMTCIRIPGSNEYLKSLSAAVTSVLENQSSSDAALKKAVEEWNQITDRIGRKKQAKAYRNSAGISN